MKTLDQIREAVKSGQKKSEAWPDSRDFSRLTMFFPVSEWGVFGFGLKEGAETPKVEPFTEEVVVGQLKSDVAFGFTKALNKRGISSGLMYEVVKMWLWVLDDPLQDFPDDGYAMYGLPLFKAIALKYGFPNPIGEDIGSESKYEEEKYD